MSERWEWLNLNVYADDLCTMVCSLEAEREELQEALRAAEKRAIPAETLDQIEKAMERAERVAAISALEPCVTAATKGANHDCPGCDAGLVQLDLLAALSQLRAVREGSKP